MVRNNTPGTKIQKAATYADFLVEQARRNGATPQQLARYAELLQGIKGEGHADLRAALQPRWDFLGQRKESVASSANIKTMITALTNDNHWAAQEFRANLIAIAERNARELDRWLAPMTTGRSAER